MARTQVVARELGRTAEAWCGGAVTIVSALATGRGCAMGTALGMHASWRWQDEPGLHWGGTQDTRVAAACLAALQADGRAGGAWASTRCDLPPSCGLKTSSQAAAAILAAARDAAGLACDEHTLVRDAVAVCRAAGVTMTGALDDQSACVLGGLHGTDNHADRTLWSRDAPAVHVALWVPDAPLPRERVRLAPLHDAAPGATHAWELAQAGRLWDAVAANHAAYAAVHHAAGLPVPDAAVAEARAAGALAAGMTGAGPAAAAFFAEPAPLADVPGGRWVWTVAR